MATKKQDVVSVQDQLKKELTTLKDRVEPPGGFLINLKGKVFTLPDGSSNAGPLECVILDWCTANTYFEGIYNPKDIKPPVCFAFSPTPADAKPSKNSPKPQAEQCFGCPQNEWESDPKGGKGKACKNTRRLLITIADAVEDTPLWVVPVSPTGLKHFDKYVNTLADLGTHPIEVVTAISFDQNETYPSLRFKPLNKHDNLNVLWQMKERGHDLLYQEPKLAA